MQAASRPLLSLHSAALVSVQMVRRDFQRRADTERTVSVCTPMHILTSGRRDSVFPTPCGLYVSMELCSTAPYTHATSCALPLTCPKKPSHLREEMPLGLAFNSAPVLQYNPRTAQTFKAKTRICCLSSVVKC